MNVASYVMQQFHKCLDICFNIGAENPLLGSTVSTIAFVTDLLASEQLSAVVLA